MRDLVGPPPCVLRESVKYGVPPGTHPRHHGVAHPFLSHLASPRWRCPSWRARLPSYLPMASYIGHLQRRWPRPMAARRRRRRGARCPLDYRARRNTPRSERPAVVAGDATTGMFVFAQRAPGPRRTTYFSSPSHYRFLLFNLITAMSAVKIATRSSYPRATLRKERQPAS